MKSIPIALVLLCSPGSPTLDPSGEVSDTYQVVTFDRSVDIPADSLAIGTVIRVKALINILQIDGHPSVTIRPHLGAKTFGDMTFVASTSLDFLIIDWTFVVTSTGPHGDVTGWGTVGVMDATGIAGAVHGDLMHSTEFDTGRGADVTFSAKWSVAHPNNRIRLEHLIVDVQ